MKILIIEDNEKHIKDAKQSLGSMETVGDFGCGEPLLKAIEKVSGFGINTYVYTTNLESAKEWIEHADGVITDMYFPRNDSTKEADQPYGIIVANECQNKNIPFVINTLYKGHGVEVMPFLDMAKENGWSYFAERDKDSKPWKEVQGKLEELIKNN